MSARYDIVVVGAGIVGLSTAYHLLRSRPGAHLAVIDKENRVAAHQSSHNSGVIHSGLYYAPGSLKSLLCRQGRQALGDFADEHGIKWERCGKIVVAVEHSELPRLRMLAQRGVANGLQGLSEIGPEELREIEPHVRCVRALVVPETGIIDFAAVTEALAREVVTSGGELLLGRRVTSITASGSDQVVSTSAGEVRARNVVACAGLQADRLDGTGDHPDEQIVPFRGSFYSLAPASRHLVRALIYPVPDPSLPFLGVHFTRRIDGEVWAGPNAVPALAREGYRRRNFSARDTLDTLAFSGSWRLARRHWKYGMSELHRDCSRRAYARELQRYIPALTAQDLRPGPSGVRAQAVRVDGTLVDDFSFGTSPGVLHVRNAPSPAATAALAIGRHLAARLLDPS